MSQFTNCQDCLDQLLTEDEIFITGRCEDCQATHERNTYDPMFDDRAWDNRKDNY